MVARDTVYSNRAAVGTRQFTIYNAYGYPVASLFSGTPYDGGYLQMWNASGQEGVYIDGANGRVRANVGFSTKNSGGTIVNGVTAYQSVITGAGPQTSTFWVPLNMTGSEDLAGTISKINELLGALRSQGLNHGYTQTVAYLTATGGIITGFA
jgi:hypothetical protein